MTTRRRPRPKPQLGDIVKVSWYDAWFDYDHGTRVFPENFPVQTVGFLIRNDPSTVSVAAELLPNQEGWRGVTNIPRAVIIAIERL